MRTLFPPVLHSNWCCVILRHVDIRCGVCVNLRGQYKAYILFCVVSIGLSLSSVFHLPVSPPLLHCTWYLYDWCLYLFRCSSWETINLSVRCEMGMLCLFLSSSRESIKLAMRCETGHLCVVIILCDLGLCRFCLLIVLSKPQTHPPQKVLYVHELPYSARAFRSRMVTKKLTDVFFSNCPVKKGVPPTAVIN